jgi:hypothetical protein
VNLTELTYADRPTPRPGQARHVCHICGKPSDKTICDECSERIRIDALTRKKREEKGDAWVLWE